MAHEVLSPMAQRFIAKGHAARTPVDETLGDRVQADTNALVTKAGEALMRPCQRPNCGHAELDHSETWGCLAEGVEVGGGCACDGFVA